MAVVGKVVDPGRPVSRMVAPVIWRLGTLVAVMAGVSVIGVVLSMQSVNRSTDVIHPTARAHGEVVRSLEDVQASVNGWEVSGSRAFRVDFAMSIAELDAALVDLEDQSARLPDVGPLVDAEVTRVRTWLTSYAQPRMATPGGGASFEQTRFQTGRELMADIVGARTRVDASLEEEEDSAHSAALLRFRVTIVTALLLMGISWILIGRARSKLLSELSEPLLALEKVVQRMLRNDPEGRAADHRGPKEVRAVARALNDFADAQSRARAVEGRIQDELHVLDSAKDDFVSNVSHELRTPLTTISGYLEMVADEFQGQLEPRHDRMLEATRRNVTRLRALIDDLLALSKAEQRASDLEPADVNQMVMDAVTDIRMTAARRGISVEVSAPDDPMMVVSDRAMLYRAFLNILTNAVKFSHDQGSVDVTVKRVRNRVEISVRDHGIGIPKAELDRLGTRFFRASNAMSNEIAGTGLGLRIVQTIIDRHAGDVIIESAEGEGTTVFVRLRLHGERTGRIEATTPGRSDQPVS
ncbi:ATP-binding protein [Nocardioides sp.]|mgnify:CR=1 FL=1|jgi:signal transduction histidine kinase|uniref:sensor histidine kinase n=1 Tax=Nocardioides sp. TaxID=35761 RepID=UPI0026055F81|nr:ATP-binding protein [Nocardioides sp.]